MSQHQVWTTSLKCSTKPSLLCDDWNGVLHFGADSCLIVSKYNLDFEERGVQTNKDCSTWERQFVTDWYVSNAGLRFEAAINVVQHIQWVAHYLATAIDKEEQSQTNGTQHPLYDWSSNRPVSCMRRTVMLCLQCCASSWTSNTERGIIARGAP